MSNNIYYCYSKPQKDFIESFGLKPLDNDPLTHPLTQKTYYRFERCELLDKALTKYKQNKIDAINYIKGLSSK